MSAPKTDNDFANDALRITVIAGIAVLAVFIGLLLAVLA